MIIGQMVRQVDKQSDGCDGRQVNRWRDREADGTSISHVERGREDNIRLIRKPVETGECHWEVFSNLPPGQMDVKWRVKYEAIAMGLEVQL